MRKLITKGGSFLFRCFALILALAILFLSGGCINAYSRDGYEITGYVKLSAPAQYNFNQTLRLLYADDVSVVVARIDRIDGVQYFTVQQSLIGNLAIGDKYALKLPAYRVSQDKTVTEADDAIVPIDASSVLLFLKEEDGGYRPLIDAASWLTLDVDKLRTEAGSVLQWEQAEYEIERMREDIALPANFYYYDDLPRLVSESDYVFIGTLLGVRQNETQKFYVSSLEMKRSFSSDSQTLQIRIDQDLKGSCPNSVEDIWVLNTPQLLENTINATSMKNVSFAPEDVAKLSPGSSYIFFVIDPPVGLKSAPKYFVNFFQGYVPISENGNTIPMFNNAPFAMQLSMNDVISDIEWYSDSEGSYEYDPNQESNSEKIDSTERENSGSGSEFAKEQIDENVSGTYWRDNPSSSEPWRNENSNE